MQRNRDIQAKSPHSASKPDRAAFYLLLVSVLILSAFASVFGHPAANVAAMNPSSIETLKTIIVDDYAPYTFVDADGQPAGFSVDLMRAVAQVMDFKLDIQVDTWEHARQALQNGEIDFLPMMAYSEERDKAFDFSVPHTIAYDAFFTRADASPIRSIEDLHGKSIIVMEGDQAHDYLLSIGFIDATQLILIDSLPQALQLLASGSGDTALMPKLVGLKLIKDSHLTNLELAPVVVEAYNRPFCFAVKAGNQALLERLSQGLSIVKATGHYDEMYQTWFGALEPQRLSTATVLKYLGGIVLVFAVLGAMPLVWSFSLRKQVAMRTRSLEKEIQERKRAERALQESESAYRTLAENLPGMVYQLDLKRRGHMEFFNDLVQPMTGYVPSELAEGEICSIEPLIVPEDRQDIIEVVKRAIENAQPFQVEYRLRHKDGRVRHFLERGRPVYGPDGEPSHIDGLILDMTERRQAEEALRESEEHYRTLFETAPVIIYALSTDGMFTALNPVFEQMTGWSCDEWLGRPFAEMFHPDDSAFAVQQFQRVLQGAGEGKYSEMRVQSKAGAVLTVEVVGVQKIVGGQMVGVSGFARDITARKWAEEALAAERALLRTLVDHLPDAVYVKDVACRKTLVNPADLRTMGAVSEAEALGKTDFDFFPHDLAAAYYADDQSVIQSGRPVLNREEMITLPDGTRGWQLTAKVPVRDSAGQVVGLVGIGHDITERKRAEEALRQRASQLALLNEIGGQMAALLDVNDVLDRAAHLVQERFGFTHVGLFTRTAGTARLVMRARAGEFAHIFPPDHSVAQGQGMVGWVGLHGETLLANDVNTEPHYVNPYPDRLPTRSELSVPICIGDEIVGVLDLQSPQPNAFDLDDVTTLETLAAQMAVAIHNARLFETERAARQQAEKLQAATQALSTTLDLQQVFERILTELRYVVPYDSASVQELKDNRLEIIGGHGFPNLEELLGESFDLTAQDNPNREVVRTKAPLILADAPAHYEGFCREPHEQVGVRAWLGVPLLFGDRLIGLITLDKQEPGFYTEEHARLALAFAAQAAIAIENARLLDETQHRNRELTLLNRVIAASATGQAVEPILEVVCRELALAFEVPQAAAALFNKEKTKAVVVADYQAEGRASVVGETIPVAASPASQHLLIHKTPLVIDDAQTDPRQAPIHDLARSGQQSTVSQLFLPLIVDGEVVGSLEVNAIEFRPFSAQEVALAQRVAEQVSGALARARLEQTQRRQSMAIEQAAESIVITDARGNILYANPAFEQISGYSHAEAFGQHLRILGSDKHDAAFYAAMRQALYDGQIWQGRMVNRRKDGALYTVDATITPVRDHAGEIVNHIATLRDVTRELQLEEQFRQAQKMEAIGRLAGGVAHDFNNLLTVIHLSARLLERQLRPQDPLWQHVHRIQDAGQRAANLTKQLLAFSRREIVEPQVLNLNQVLGDLDKMLRRLIGEDVELTLLPVGELWPVKIDPTQVEQVVVNLAVNARDAMPHGGKLTIETANVALDAAYTAQHLGVEPGEYVMLAVSDTGQGMTEEVKAHLFEPFFTTKEKGKGTGLGLATVFGIVKQNGGHIGAYSEVERGTTFKIYLPRVTASIPAPTSPPQATTALGTETLLLVEDEPQVRELARDILQAQGYQVLAARDGVEALQMAEAHEGPIHLLLTDVVMPRLSGKALADRLLLTRSEMRVLFTSGYTDNAIVHHGVLAEGIHFLSKPFELEALARKVRDVLDSGERPSAETEKEETP